MCKAHRTVFLIGLFAVAGCYPVNKRLENFDRDAGYRFKNLTAKSDTPSAHNPDELFVILTFSGGGTRAAALAYGVMQQLAHTEIDNGSRTLLDEVDVISSVSGGSFTAAYYALFQEKLFESFEEDFLKRDVQGALFWRAVLPWNLVRLSSLWYGRSDLAAEYYNKHIFHEKTYADLVNTGRRPFIILNAADMSFGAPFEFTQEQFDLLYSDLEKLHVARAVAASSAFPGLLTPVTLRNYERQKGEFSEPLWIENAMEDRGFAWRRYRQAQQARSYADLQDRPYVHLMDGGIAENLGVPAIYRALSTTDSEWSVLRRINLEKVKNVVVIYVNASTKTDSPRDRRSYPPNLVNSLLASVNGLLSTNVFESAATLSDFIEQTNKEQQCYEDCLELLKACHCDKSNMTRDPLPLVDFHVVEVSFGCITNQAQARYFNKMATSFYLPDKEVDCLASAGQDILLKSEEFKALLKSLRGKATHVKGAIPLSSCE